MNETNFEKAVLKKSDLVYHFSGISIFDQPLAKVVFDTLIAVKNGSELTPEIKGWVNTESIPLYLDLWLLPDDIKLVEANETIIIGSKIQNVYLIEAVLSVMRQLLLKCSEDNGIDIGDYLEAIDRRESILSEAIKAEQQVKLERQRTSKSKRYLTEEEVLETATCILCEFKIAVAILSSENDKYMSFNPRIFENLKINTEVTNKVKSYIVNLRQDTPITLSTKSPNPLENAKFNQICAEDFMDESRLGYFTSRVRQSNGEAYIFHGSIVDVIRLQTAELMIRLFLSEFINSNKNVFTAYDHLKQLVQNLELGEENTGLRITTEKMKTIRKRLPLYEHAFKVLGLEPVNLP